MLPRLFALLFALSALALTQPAQAWTNAHVREVSAEVQWLGEGRAQVTLELALDVQGGWLERLQLPGLDEDLNIDPEQGAWLVREDGTQAFAKTRMRHGELELRFDRSIAPHRGLHRLGVRYETVLPAQAGELGAGGTRVRFDLPGFEAGLDRAEIRWLVAPGARGVEDTLVAQSLSDESADAGRRLLRFTRLHVPRSTPWSVTVDLPGKAAGAGHAAGAKTSRPNLLTGGLLSLFVLAFGWLARASARRSARLDGQVARPLGALRLRRGARTGLTLSAALLWSLSPLGGALLLLGLALTFADGYQRSQEALSLGRYVPLTRRDLARCRRLAWARVVSGAPCLDLASLSGLSAAALLVAALLHAPGAFDMARDPWGLGALAALACMVSSSRLLRPRALVDQVMLLARTARTMLAVGAALRLHWYVPTDGTPAEPRLRVLPAVRHAGLLRVEFAADTRRAAEPLLLMVVVEADSHMDGWVARWAPGATRELSAGARRAVYIVPSDDPTELLDGLFAALASQTQAAWDARLGEARAAA